MAPAATTTTTTKATRRSCRNRNKANTSTTTTIVKKEPVKQKRQAHNESMDPTKTTPTTVVPDLAASSASFAVLKRKRNDTDKEATPDDAPPSSLPDVLSMAMKGVLDPKQFDTSNNNMDVSKKNETTKTTTTTRPTPEECFYVVHALGKLHPRTIARNMQRRQEQAEKQQQSSTSTPMKLKKSGICGDTDSVADGVIGTILSQNTTSKNSTHAFRQLKQTFPTYDTLMALPKEKAISKLENAIRSGGLAQTKAQRIYDMLSTVQDEQGVPSLEYLRSYTSTAAIKKELSRFKGLGPKTISCVLLFTMGMEEFPVDTHVLRISKQLGWIGTNTSREAAYEHLNDFVPGQLKLDLHCLLIDHGKQCHRCAARGKPQFPPRDGTKLDCPLVGGDIRGKAKKLIQALLECNGSKGGGGEEGSAENVAVKKETEDNHVGNKKRKVVVKSEE